MGNKFCEWNMCALKRKENRFYIVQRLRLIYEHFRRTKNGIASFSFYNFRSKCLGICVQREDKQKKKNKLFICKFLNPVAMIRSKWVILKFECNFDAIANMRRFCKAKWSYKNKITARAIWQQQIKYYEATLESHKWFYSFFTIFSYEIKKKKK